MKKILILGANSDIAKECANIWKLRNEQLFLVGRNKENLKKIAIDLKIENKFILHADLSEINNHEEIFNKAISAMNGLDFVLISYGVLSDQKKCETDVQLALKDININSLSVISFLTIMANFFEKQRSGKIAVITSVAGDRGRSSNYLYGCSKAMISTFLSGLRQRLFKYNIKVIDIKPGLVSTKMTKNFKKNILWSDPKIIGKKIVKIIDQGKEVAYLPSFWFYLMFLIKITPLKIFKRLKF